MLGPRTRPEARDRGRSGTGNAAPAEAKRPVITPRQAASLARQRNGGGRVLAVKLRGEVYKVKLLRDGEVKIVRIAEKMGDPAGDDFPEDTLPEAMIAAIKALGGGEL